MSSLKMPERECFEERYGLLLDYGRTVVALTVPITKEWRRHGKSI